MCTPYSRLLVEWRVEEILNLAIEVSSEFEREFERWIVAVTFDRVDCLAGDADCICEVALGDAFGFAVLTDVVFHEY